MKLSLDEDAPTAGTTETVVEWGRESPGQAGHRHRVPQAGSWAHVELPAQDLPNEMIGKSHKVGISGAFGNARSRLAHLIAIIAVNLLH